MRESWERRFLAAVERLKDNCPLSDANQKPEVVERWKAAYNELFTLANALKVRRMPRPSGAGSALFFVDCEGADVVNQRLREFGAVEFETRETFYGKPEALLNRGSITEVMIEFAKWIAEVSGKRRPVFVSDNPAYDWQVINMLFLKYLGYNPFGHSARRIGDFYAGLVGDWRNTQGWKRLRVTPHDHDPVHDALGNAEAFARILAGER